MSKIVTQESHLQRANAKWNGFYGYSKTVYVKAKNKIIVTCPVHGDFEVEALSHLSCGCKKCAKDKLSKLFVHTKEQFEADGNYWHQFAYNYDKVVYVNSHTKVTITCPKHGDFDMTPNNHSKSKGARGCPKCGDIESARKNTKTQEQFLAEVFENHGTKYDTSLVVYVNDRAKVDLICPIHGLFSIAATHVKQGCGCKKCSPNGYSVMKPGLMYVLLGNDNTTKVGITNRDMNKRLRELNKHSGKDFVIHSTYSFENGQVAWDLEDATLAYLRSNYEGMTEKFHGSTECFKDVDLQALLSFIVPQATHN